jgi:hypothetical protein
MQYDNPQVTQAQNTATSGGGVAVRGPDPTKCPVGTRNATTAANSANARANDIHYNYEEVRKSQSQASHSCLDKYSDLSLGSMFGFPSLNPESFLHGLASAACRVIDTTIYGLTAPLRVSQVLPGGLEQVAAGVNVGSAQQGRINPNPTIYQTNDGGTSAGSQAGSGIFDRLQKWFK